MSSRYRAISHDTFRATMQEIGFFPIEAPGNEYAFARSIHNGPNPGRFAVMIYSSVHRGTGMTRECGGDAIRVLLMDNALGRGVLDWRVYRTVSALDNTKERARDAWRYVMNQSNHCQCGALMVERTGQRGPFFGCTAYPICKRTRPVATGERMAA